ncbi:replication protein A 70 kDa DNA-binding subunit B-like [Ananas comosus]|uniref:Replication protein A 70 kDa DNA-binding subunit B-like n=1 Tax=Ananas comosus TaxID=4615 RepID=A0A6P5EHB1_ANACO|nr:replication protein A 70 kDa DNA-binding subunit B-like [Ananas comosus]
MVLEKETHGPVIIILAGMTVRTYRDKIYLSTSSASRLYIELEIPEVTDFLHKIQEPVDRIQRTENKQQATISPQEEMHINRKKIADLLHLEETEIQNAKFTCEVTLKSIDCSYGWWYRACYECKSAIKSYADAFWCRQCGKNDQAPIPWYKLNAIVEDDTGDANFTIFGRIAQDLICVPAQKLATADDSDRYALPPVIKNIIGKKHVFQVMVDPHNTDMGIRSFKVIKNFSSQIAPKIQKQNDGHEIEEQLLLSPPKDLHADLSEEVTPQIISHSRLLQDESRETFDMEQPRRKRLRFAEDDDGPSSSTRE